MNHALFFLSRPSMHTCFEGRGIGNADHTLIAIECGFETNFELGDLVLHTVNTMITANDCPPQAPKSARGYVHT
jgi:hypothetical protein